MRLAARLAAEDDAETGLEHLLAGLLGVRPSVAVIALERAGVPAETLTARAATGEPRTEPGPHASEPNRKVIELALRESLTARHGYVGTGHLLLGFTGLDGARQCPSERDRSWPVCHHSDRR